MNVGSHLRPTLAIASAALAVTALSVITPVGAQSPIHTGKPATTTAATAAKHGARQWIAAWRAAAQQPATGISDDGFSNQTVRMVIRSDTTGSSLRVRLSNAYGTAPVGLGHVSVAKHTTGPDIAKRSRRAVTFARQSETSIPVGEEVVSDPVKLKVKRGESLDVSVFLPQASGPATWHKEAEATTYISQPGDWTTEPGGSPYQDITPSWFFLDGVDVKGAAAHGTVVAFGDSITDGHYSTIDGNGRWPDWLARRTSKFSVVNEGIGGNKILTDSPTAGVSALHRVDRDMVDQLGVTDAIFLEGINDIDADATAAQVIAGMKQIIATAHAHCLTILGGTLTPFQGSSGYTATRELAREKVNRFIRRSGAFDGVVDFDKATRDPHNPLALKPKYDTGGGHLHPNDLGYKAMGDAIHLHLLTGQRTCS